MTQKSRPFRSRKPTGVKPDRAHGSGEGAKGTRPEGARPQGDRPKGQRFKGNRFKGDHFKGEGAKTQRSPKVYGPTRPGSPSRSAPRTPSLEVSRAELLARVLYRDALIIVVNKPSGIPVHGGPGGGPNLEDLFDILRFGLPRPPSLAHRLDRDTSGCLVLGRHPKALRKTGAMFSSGRTQKTYWAVVEGVPKKPEGVITYALRKETPGQGWKMVVHPHGQEAVTTYKVRGTVQTPHGARSWLELEPKTGRTHQIRVHCAEIGCPVVGDPVYGRQPYDPALGPLQLHSRAIVLPLSPSRPPIKVIAPIPNHMRADLATCGYVEEKAPPPYVERSKPDPSKSHHRDD